MSIKIEINQHQLTKNDEMELEFLPAKIDGNGTANAEEYFKNYTRTNNTFLCNALRGYPLSGTKLDVPPGVKALVLQEPSERSEDNERTLRVTGTFSKFTYWNYDKLPSNADGYKQALDWTQVATQLAEPISEADVLAEVESHTKAEAAEENTT